LLTTERAPTRSRLGFLTNNLALKALSGVAAILIYGLVHGTSDAHRTLDINLVGLMPAQSQGRILVRQLPPGVRVTVRGPKPVLDELKADDLGSLQLDLRSGTTHVDLDGAMLHLPTGITVEQIDPPSFDLTWEDRVARPLAVRAQAVGSALPGFVVAALPMAQPSVIPVEGPQSLIASLQHARVTPFDIGGLGAGHYERTLTLEAPPAGVVFKQQTVTVSLDVTREIAERVFTKIKVQVLGQPTAHTIPPEVDVHLRCAPDVASGLRAELIVAQTAVDSKELHGSVRGSVAVSLDGCEATVVPTTITTRW
jgi:hypothetical protein